LKIDGHIHSPFCPHGSLDSFETYIEKAINNKFTHITFTEHAPAPNGFHDTVPNQDSFMKMELLDPYITALQKLKVKYASSIQINIGLEVDYIQGFEEKTKKLLNQVGSHLDDSILSVHFLLYQKKYECIDFSPDHFSSFVNEVGSLRYVYEKYYDTVRRSILAELGVYKPRRIGHPTLIHKFQHSHKEVVDDHDLIIRTLQDIKKNQYQIDMNSAGLAKKYCLESYPPAIYIQYAKQQGIPLIFGSDAHCADDLHQYYEDVYTTLK
jgi:histidinol-phosphatase (PHP family)